MMKLPAFCLCAMMILNCCAPETKQIGSEIETLLQAYCNTADFSGVVLVADQNGLCFSRAYGLADRELHVEMDPKMKFRIASLSKPFTATLILKLVEEGLLDLHDYIADFLPDYWSKTDDSIQIHHLLNHTSGILGCQDPDTESIQEKLPHSLDDLVKIANNGPLYFKSGKGFHYSNFAYSILARIAEEVTGKKYDMLLDDYILKPAGMEDTRQYDPERVEENLAKGYEYKLLEGFVNATYIDPSYVRGSGDMISTAYDLEKFDHTLFSGKLIADSLLTKMLDPADGLSYGYGWEIQRQTFNNSADSLTVISHTGSINGFGAFMTYVLEDGICVIVLKNFRCDTYINPAYASAIGHQILQILYGAEPEIPERSIARELGLIIGQQGIDQALQAYYKIRDENPDSYYLGEEELNKLGIELLFRFGMTEEAVKIFYLNMISFPISYNTYDSYAYGLRQKGDYENAIRYYRKGLEVLKEYPEKNNSETMIREAENATKAIEEMHTVLEEERPQ